MDFSSYLLEVNKKLMNRVLSVFTIQIDQKRKNKQKPFGYGLKALLLDGTGDCSSYDHAYSSQMLHGGQKGDEHDQQPYPPSTGTPVGARCGGGRVSKTSAAHGAATLHL